MSTTSYGLKPNSSILSSHLNVRHP